MRLSFRMGDCVVNSPGVSLYLLWKSQCVDNFPNMAGGGVVMMMFVSMLSRMLMFVGMLARVIMMVCMLFFPMDGDLHMGARDAAGRRIHGLQPDAGQAQVVHGLQKAFFVLQQLIQRRH